MSFFLHFSMKIFWGESRKNSYKIENCIVFSGFYSFSLYKRRLFSRNFEILENFFNSLKVKKQHTPDERKENKENKEMKNILENISNFPLKRCACKRMKSNRIYIKEIAMV